MNAHLHIFAALLPSEVIRISHWTRHSLNLQRLFTHFRQEQSLCFFNLLKPNDIYMCVCVCVCRTAALTSRRYILNIYSTNIHTKYFKHAA